eukprot:364072-Chlamydomonas_euryale.AAC.14
MPASAHHLPLLVQGRPCDTDVPGGDACAAVSGLEGPAPCCCCGYVPATGTPTAVLPGGGVPG